MRAARTLTAIGAAALLMTACPADEPDPGPETTPAPTEEAASEPDPEAPTVPEGPEREAVEAPPLDVELVVDGLPSLADATAPPGEDRLFVVTLSGTIEIVTDAGVADAPFLDIRDRVQVGGEQGMLGLAFPPDHPDDDRVFVHYTGSGGQTVLSEFRLSDDPDRADPGSEEVLLTVSQPAANHNGGMVAFGPDGMLYLALGDGGGADDQFGNGQDPSTLLGTILRLDVSTPGGYEIPDDNPWAGGGEGAPEVWAYGLRNPWKFAFDDDLLYIADVGQSDWEWVNVVPADESGLNHGWSITEGSRCFRAADCPTDGLVSPVFEYENTGTDCAIVGGFVYRGEAIEGLAGTYLYADYCSGFVRSFRYDAATGAVADHEEHVERGAIGRVQGFGRDAAGELYVLTEDGGVWRIVAAD